MTIVDERTAGWTFVNAADTAWKTLEDGITYKLLGGPLGAGLSLFHLKAGSATADHIHQRAEFAYLLDGTASVNDVPMEPGHAYVADAGTRHIATSAATDATFLAVIAPDAPAGASPSIAEPDPVVGWTYADTTDMAWTEIRPGLRVKYLGDGDGYQFAVFEIDGGTSVRAHVHTRSEFAYVLSGEVSVNDTALVAGGAYAAEPGSSHDHFSSAAGATFISLFEKPA